MPVWWYQVANIIYDLKKMYYIGIEIDALMRYTTFILYEEYIIKFILRNTSVLKQSETEHYYVLIIIDIWLLYDVIIDIFLYLDRANICKSMFPPYSTFLFPRLVFFSYIKLYLLRLFYWFSVFCVLLIAAERCLTLYAKSNRFEVRRLKLQITNFT